MAQAYISRRNRLPSNTYKVRLYRYGEIWKTLTLAKGDAVTLTVCDTAYSDDTFYGWSTDPQSTTRTYTTNTFRPTGDMNLYAIFSYTQSGTVQQAKTVSVTLDQDQIIKITDATVGTAYTITRITPTSIAQGTSTAPSTGYVTYFPIVNVNETVLQSGTTTSATITYSASKGTPISGGALSGTSSPSSAPTYNIITAYPSIRVDYTTTISQTGVKYRVVSHDNDSVLNVFVYGEILKTVTIKEGLSTTIGEVISQYSDDTFYGYSTEPYSTTKAYTATQAITPHGEVNVYAIFSYLSDETEFLNMYSDSDISKSVTINADGNCTITGKYTAVKVSSGTATVETESTAVSLGTKGTYVKINSINVSGTTPITKAVSAGNVIEACGYFESTVDSSRSGYAYTYRLDVQYPNHPTEYRVSAHI